jgi:hypothetical protein
MVVQANIRFFWSVFKGLLFIPTKRNPNLWSNFIIKCRIELILGQRNFQHLKFWISNFRHLLVLNILDDSWKQQF